MSVDSATVGCGTPEFAAALLTDLYVRLRRDLQRWASVTHQTPQPRMGYVGQHLVSVVYDVPGGRSGARGDDLKFPDGSVAEIKCCYRVDQLGTCKTCGAKVASIEKSCPNQDCGSREIIRKDDSKWLLSPKSEQELQRMFEPKCYFLVLFEFVDLASADDIDVKIYKIEPDSSGFKYCMVDYYFNIRAKSKSKAPFNLWPNSLKLHLMKPRLEYWAVIKPDDSIETKLFPGRDSPQLLPLPDLRSCMGSKTLSNESLIRLAKAVGISTETRLDAVAKSNKKSRSKLLSEIQAIRETRGIDDGDFADLVSEAVYSPLIGPHQGWVKENLEPTRD